MYTSRLTLICIKCLPEDPRTIFLATSFTPKILERSDSMYSSILMLENIWYDYFAWSVPNSQEIVNLLQFSSVHCGTTNGKKLTISCAFGPLQVKWWFLAWKKRNTWSPKYSAWVPGDPKWSSFGSVMSLLEETYKFSEPNCYT